MGNRIVTNGWERLPSGYDVEFRHSIPVRLSDNGRGRTLPESALVEEVTSLGRLRVRLGEWAVGEKPDEREARLFVMDDQLGEVLRRLALSSAAIFFDRYHKTVDKNDVDWDRLEFLQDFRAALQYCGLQWGEVEPDTLRGAYLETMHRETRRLADAAESPSVEPE